MTAVNDPPVAAADTYTVTAAGAALDVRANDSPGPANEGQSLAVPTVVAAPTSGTATAEPNGTITYLPSGTTAGDVSFTYSVCDSGGACANGTVSLEVIPQLAVADATGAEGDSGTTTATFGSR